MTKRELMEATAERYPQDTKRQVEAVVENVFQTLTDALVHGARVELRGFGGFSVKERPARAGRHPPTGAVGSVPATRVPV